MDQNAKVGAVRRIVTKNNLPRFFETQDASAMQQYLIRNDASGEISHFIAVPMHRLARYVNDPLIQRSRYVWKLRNMNCTRLRKLCSRLGLTQGSFKNGRGTKECLLAIQAQPGNRNFSWDRFRTNASSSSSTTTSSMEAAQGSSVVTPAKRSSTVSQLEIIETPMTKKRSLAPKRPVMEPPSHPPPRRGAVAPHPAREEDMAPNSVNDPAASAPLGPLSWDTLALILEQQAQSIVSKRNQEFAYYRELSAVREEEIRWRMLRSLEMIQQSIQVEEQELEQLQAQYHACIVRASDPAHTPTAGGYPTTGE